MRYDVIDPDVAMQAADMVYQLGRLLTLDDIDDFPWDPYEGGPGHVKGMPHHGLIGMILQEVGVFAAYAATAMAAAQPVSTHEYSLEEILSITRSR